jgi:hypothetical protein
MTQIKERTNSMCVALNSIISIFTAVSFCAYSQRFMYTEKLVKLLYVLSGPHNLVQILYFWTLHIVLFLSKNAILFIFQNTTFRKLDSVSVFRWNLLSWAQSIELDTWTSTERGYTSETWHMFILNSRRRSVLCLVCIPCLVLMLVSEDWAQLSRFYLKTEGESSLRQDSVSR